jgi:isopenicillin N synthase-like dioxygenase
VTARHVPEISLRDFTHGSPDQKIQFQTKLFDGLRDYGFVILTDHNVGGKLLDEAYRLSEAAFALPHATKSRYCGGMRGYTPFGTEHAKGNHLPDLKEFWQVGRDVVVTDTTDPLFPPNVWPEEIGGFDTTFTDLFQALDETGRLLLRALAPSLGLKHDYFDPLVKHGTSLLRLLHYPPIPDGTDPQCVRAAAHEDINFITILVAAKGAGLELLDRDGTWLSVQTSPRNLIIDSGDMLARLTNGIIPATTHRVINPAGPNVSRYSMPFFMHPSVETSLACLASCIGDGAKYPPITAGAFLQQRLREIGLTK